LITGWGVIETNAKIPSNELQKASMKIVEKSQCLNVIGSIEYNGHFCAFQKIGVGICIVSI
jgi:hypothetical protein